MRLWDIQMIHDNLDYQVYVEPRNEKAKYNILKPSDSFQYPCHVFNCVRIYITVMFPYELVNIGQDDIIKWKHFSRYWPFVRGFHRSPAQRPVTRSFDVFFDLCLNKRLSKQSLGWWLETPSRSSWRHNNELFNFHFSIHYTTFDVWVKKFCRISKGTFEIPYKISYTYIERCFF